MLFYSLKESVNAAAGDGICLLFDGHRQLVFYSLKESVNAAAGDGICLLFDGHRQLVYLALAYARP